MWSCLPIFSLAIKIHYFHIFSWLYHNICWKIYPFLTDLKWQIFICKYWYISASLFLFDLSVWLFYIEPCKYSHLIILCQYFNYSEPFFFPDEFHMNTTSKTNVLPGSNNCFDLENLNQAHRSCGSTTQKVCLEPQSSGKMLML